MASLSSSCTEMKVFHTKSKDPKVLHTEVSGNTCAFCLERIQQDVGHSLCMDRYNLHVNLSEKGYIHPVKSSENSSNRLFRFLKITN